MKIKFLSLSLFVALSSTGYAAAIELNPEPNNYHEKSLGLSTTSKNFKVVPQELGVAIAKYDMTDSYFENYANHRFKATSHIYASMNTRQRMLYLMFTHTTYLNDIFFPKINPLLNKNVSDAELKKDSLVNKLNSFQTDPYLLDNISGKESALRALRGHYDFYMRDLFDVKFYAKEGSVFTYKWSNYSGLNVKSIHGNLRILDKNTGVVLGDTTVDLHYRGLPHFSLPANMHIDNRKITLPSTMPGWDSVPVTDLAFKFQPISVVTSKNETINIHNIYKYNTEKFIF